MRDLVDAFIPLKGHSERVPRKNMRDFGGAPLFHTIVRTLEASKRVDTIYIDTDSDEIADSATGFGSVVVIRRRDDLRGDDVSVNLLIQAFLDRFDSEHIIQTHATNPLLATDTIDRAVAQYFADPGITSLFAVTRYQARFFTADLEAVNHDPTELLPTQQLSPLFLENSNFYIFGNRAFREHGRRITDRTAMFEMEPMEAIDIDEERDFALATSLAGSAVTLRAVGGEHA